MSDNPFLAFVTKYRHNPVAFVREVLGAEPDPWQIQLLAWIAEDERRISVASGHGVGKSTVIAWAMLWFVLTRFPVKVVVTAPTSAQLYDAMFAELKRWVKELPPAIGQLLESKTDRVEVKASATEAFISARTSRSEQPEALQGVHCFRHGTVDVLTASGWKPLEDVTLDDRVLTKRVGEREAWYDHPTEVIEAPYSGEMHEYEGRFLRYSVTPGHRFEYERRQCNKLVGGATERWVADVREVQHIQKMICRIPTTFDLRQPESREYIIPAHTSLRYDRPLIEHEAYAVDESDWAEFLGWYVAEGSLGKNSAGNVSTVSIGQSRENNAAKYERIAELVERMGFRASRMKTAVNVCSVQVALHIQDVAPGLCAVKRIPECVFDMPRAAQRRFLDGFRLGDGWGEHQYFTSSPLLAHDVQRLILLTGGYATINFTARKGTLVQGFDKKTYRNGDYYRIREWYGRSVDTASIRPEKRTTTHYEGLVNCLTMPEGMFYVRDRGTTKPFWTHNSEHVMLVADEASGVPEGVFEAAAGSMSGHSAVTILAGNPTKSSGLFYETHHKLKDRWKTLTVSCLDSPRVSDAYVGEMKDRYGEDSNAYRVRVLGLFPLRDDDTIIPVDLVDSAQHRDVTHAPNAPEVWGLDVARFGSDASALCKRRSNVVPAGTRIWRGLDLMQLCGAVKAEYDACPADERPVELLVDSIGMGAGVVDRLRELRLPARGVNVSESPAMKETYANLRAELWYQALAWLQARDSKLPKDERLFAELTAPKYQFTSGGKIQVESKADMKKRGMPSPNCADAFVLTFASDAATATGVAGGAGGWHTPLRRNIPGVA